MIHLIMTHSPHLVAICTNKPLGEHVANSPHLMHRLSWLAKHRKEPTHTDARVQVTENARDKAPRERTT